MENTSRADGRGAEHAPAWNPGGEPADARAVLRVEVEADLNGFVPLDRAEVMVAYGPVEIGGKIYICPVRSVGIWRARSVNMLTEWNDSLGFLALGSLRHEAERFSV